MILQAMDFVYVVSTEWPLVNAQRKMLNCFNEFMTQYVLLSLFSRADVPDGPAAAA